MAHDIKCIIPVCDNSKSFIEEAGREVWFYEFPTDEEFRKKWIKKCGKSDNWNPTCCYVCSEHFPEEDFAPSTESESSVKRKLVCTAVPILRLQNECDILETINEGNEVTQYCPDEQTEAGEETLKTDENTNFVLAKSYEQLLQNYQKVAQLNDDLKRHVCLNKRSLDSKKRQIKKLEKEVTDLRSQIDAQHSQMNRFEQSLKHFFTGAQKHLIVTQKTDGEWNTEALIRTLSIRYLSERCYNFLCQNLVYSLPDLVSLQQWVSKINFRQGILHEFLCIMQINAKELTDEEKIVVLQFGRMEVKRIYEYKKATDEMIGPYSHMHIVLVAGLFAKWKQPVYFAFDTEMTSDVLLELIRKLHDMSYCVIACVSDWYENMSNLWKQLKITSKRPYFRHPINDKKVYYFVDASCLLRNIRNILIEEGFTLNAGKIVNTEPLKELISSSDWSISKEHLEVCKDEQQGLKLATELFCFKNAAILKRDSAPLAYSTGVFIENISKWYAIARLNYGAKMFEQNLTLTTTSDMISKLVTANNKQIFLLQEAMLMSINSLRLVPLNLWERYNTIYNLPCEKLNNNELNNLFCQIRGKECHITPSNAICKLRGILFVKNQENDFLTQKVIWSLNYTEVQAEEEEEEDSASLDTSGTNLSSIVYTEDDEVHYLIATVADKFLGRHPELGTRIRDLTLGPPYENTLVNIESFVEPSDQWALQARQLNKIFLKFHKKELLTGIPDLTKQLIDIVKNLYPNINLEVAKCFLHERLMLRMKYLNAELKETQTCSKKEEDQAATGSDNQ